MKVGIILQARMASSRRPYKIAALALGKPLLYHQVKRIALFSRYKIPLIVATTINHIDDATAFIAAQAGAHVFRGDENDVMKRYLDTAKKYKLDGVIRICGDDPLVDPKCIASLYKEARKNPKADFITASHKKGWMLGTSGEYFTTNALKKAYTNASDFEKEHVVLHFINHPDTFKNIKLTDNSSSYPYSLTVDFQKELSTVISIIEFFKDSSFSQTQLLNALNSKKIKLKHKPQFFNR